MGRTVAVAEVLALPAALPQTVPSPHLPSPHGFRGAGGQGDMRGPLGMGHRWERHRWDARPTQTVVQDGDTHMRLGIDAGRRGALGGDFRGLRSWPRSRRARPAPPTSSGNSNQSLSRIPAAPAVGCKPMQPHAIWMPDRDIRARQRLRHVVALVRQGVYGNETVSDIERSPSPPGA